MDYKKILKGVVDIINTTEKSDIGFAKICTYIGENCPELKESNDERIRNLLYCLIRDRSDNWKLLENNGVSVDMALAWIEKQGESYTKSDVDDAYLKGVTNTKNEIEKQYEANYQIRKDIATFIFNYKGDIKDRAKWMDYLGIKVSFAEKQGEQKPAEKVEPQFHKGDWIVHHGTENIYQVVAVIDNQYQLKYGDNYTIQNCADVDRCARLYDVAKDAKDGDVLVMQKTRGTYESIFIFNKIENNRIIQYLHYFITDTDEEVCEARSIDGFLGFVGTNVHPATKEQRDTLMKAMADAGWEFDFEKKELKKIENEIEIPFGAKDSELQEATYYIPQGFHAEIDDNKVVFKKGEKPTAWSEEDEDVINHLLAICSGANRYRQFAGCLQEDITKYQTWLKSLKDRYTWKPSKEQIIALRWILNNIPYCSHKEEISGLLEQIKDL